MGFVYSSEALNFQTGDSEACMSHPESKDSFLLYLCAWPFLFHFFAFSLPLPVALSFAFSPCITSS